MMSLVRSVIEVGQFIYIKTKLTLFAERDRNGLATDKINHRFINREARIRVDDLVARVDQRQNREEDNRLAARDDNHFFRRNLDAA